MNIKKINQFVIIALLCSLKCTAQNAALVKAAYPNQEAVFTSYNVELKFMIKNGIVVAESNYQRELMVLSEKNAAAYSRSRVYHSGFNELKNIDAYTKVPDGDSYKKVKIGEQLTNSSSSQSVFFDDSKETSFDFLGMVQNATQHLEYTTFHKDAHLLSPFYLPGGLPVMNGSYTVIVPNDINIKYVVKNNSKSIFKFTEEKRKKETIYKWVVNNYKAEDGYGNAPDDSYYDPHIITYVTSFKNNNVEQPYFGSIENLYNWNLSFTKDLNTTPDPALKKIVDSLIAGKKTETEKASAIYKWVQQHIKYIAFEAGLQGFTPRQAADVCNKRYGDCKDMSSIITQMLRMANIKAYYTWIGTRHLPYKYSETPLPIVDNHMISTAFIDNKWIFLDGTVPHAKYGMPPYHIQTKETMVAISDKEYKILVVPTSDATLSGMVDSTFVSFTKDGLKGIEKVDYFGYDGERNYTSLLYRDEISTKEYVKTRMGKASNKFILGNFKINETNPGNNNINITADFEIPGYGKKVGNEYYLNLNLEKLFENQTIDTAKRKVPIEIDFKYTYKQYHILQIPEGYTVTYKPNDFKFENELVSLKIIYEIKNGKLIAFQEVINKSLYVEVDKFNLWNAAAKAVAPQYKEQIVLEKK
jgi:Domain of Unknown Function with PDB structure (DUF3857)/Transglutaminase-like superfamily